MSVVPSETEKFDRLPWSLAHAAANAASAQLTVFGPVFTLFLSEIGFSKGHIGLLFSLFPFAGLLALLAAQPLAGLGYKRSYLIFWASRYLAAATLLAVPTVLARSGLATTAAFVTAAILAFAICRALGETAYYPWSQEFVPAAIRGRFYATYYGLFTAASFASVLLSSYLVSGSRGLSRFTLLIALGVLAGGVTVWLAAHIPGGAPIRAAGPAGTSRRGLSPLSDHNFRRYLGVVAFVTLGSAPLTSFLPLFLKEQLSLGVSTVILVQTGSLLGALLAGYAAGRIVDRRGSKSTMLANLALTALLPAAWMLLPRHSAWSLAAAWGISFFSGAASQGWLIGSSRLLFGDVIPPDQKTSFTAIHYAWSGVVGGVGPLAAGWLLDRSAPVPRQLLGVVMDPYADLFLASLVLSLLAFPLLIRLRGDAPARVTELVGVPE